jgi:hypothetical protein
MRPEILVIHKSELAFFKGTQARYLSILDECGDIRKSLALLKKELQARNKKLSASKWTRLHSALMSGEITRGKPSTPGDWAAQEIKLFKAERAAV